MERADNAARIEPRMQQQRRQHRVAPNAMPFCPRKNDQVNDCSAIRQHFDSPVQLLHIRAVKIIDSSHTGKRDRTVLIGRLHNARQIDIERGMSKSQLPHIFKCLDL